jgi:transposase
MPRTGRPPLLDEQLQAELVNYLKLGCYLETACSMVGIDRHTLNAWSKRGAREKRRREQHEHELAQEKEADKQRQRKIRTEERDRRAKRDKEHRAALRREQRYVDFHTAVEKAIATAELGDLATIASAAKGGHVTEKRTNPDGSTVEKRTRPEWQAAAWRLERRNPQRWSQVRRVELSGNEERPVALTLADAVKAAYSKKLAREREHGANGSNGVPTNGTPTNGAARRQGGSASED